METKKQINKKIIILERRVTGLEKLLSGYKDLEKILQNEKDRVQKYLDVAEVAIVAIDKNGEVSFINKKGCEILGYKYKRIIGKDWFSNFIPERTKDYAREFQKKLLAGEIKPGSHYENPVLTKSGEERIIIWRHSLLKDETGNITGHIKSGADITELKIAEESLHKVNRALMVVTKCDQAMVHAKEEQELLNEVCKIIVYAGGYRFAWVGYPENDDIKTVSLAAYAGEEADFLKKITITWADTKLGRGPTGTAIRTGKPSKCNDTLIDPNYSAWRPYAAKLRYNSSIAIPLISNGKVFGALTICAVKQNAFDVREIKLLTDLTNDLAFGIMALRTRAKQKEAEDALRKSEKRFKQIAENAHVWMWEVDTKGMYTYSNPEVEKILGFKPEEIVGEKHFYDLFAPNIKEELKKESFKIIKRKKTFRNFINPNIDKNGNIVILETSGTPVIDEKGNFSGYRGADIDVTKSKNIEAELGKHRKHLEELVELRTKELQESEEKYKSVIENIGIGVVLISPNMEILTLNKQMRKWFPDIDVSKKPICYKSFNNPPREEICSYCPTHKTFMDGQVHESVTETPMGDKVVNYRIISSPIKDKEGKVTAAIEMVEDITLNKELKVS